MTDPEVRRFVLWFMQQVGCCDDCITKLLGRSFTDDELTRWMERSS